MRIISSRVLLIVGPDSDPSLYGQPHNDWRCLAPNRRSSASRIMTNASTDANRGKCGKLVEDSIENSINQLEEKLYSFNGEWPESLLRTKNQHRLPAAAFPCAFWW
jgi:hypothetical protein